MLVVYAIGIQVVFAIATAIGAWALTSKLRSELITSNNKATGKNKKELCNPPSHHVNNCLDVHQSVHNYQVQSTIGTAIVLVAIVLTVIRIRRGIRTGRTMYIVACILGTFIGFFGSPLALSAAFGGFPAAMRVTQTVAAVASIAAIIMLFRPESQRYFDARSPKVAVAGGARRGGLFGGMFQPPAPRERKPPAGRGPASSAASRAEVRLAKSKSRNDPEAIARSEAEARNRARSSKSRRTEL